MESSKQFPIQLGKNIYIQKSLDDYNARKNKYDLNKSYFSENI